MAGQSQSMNEALEKLYREHRQGLYTYALSLTFSAQMAEDAIQAGFLGVMRSCSGTNNGLVEERFDNLVAYVFRAVRNAALDLGRSQVRRRDLSENLFQTFQLSDGVDPSQIALAKERDAAVRAAIDELDEKDQEAVVLKLFAGLTFEQAGEATSTSPKTIATRYRRALDKLQTQLKGRI